MKTLIVLLLAALLALLPLWGFGQGTSFTATGTITAAASTCTAGVCVQLQSNQNYGGLAIQITGTFTGTIQFEGSSDGAAFVAITGIKTADGSAATSATAAGLWQFPTGGLSYFRARGSAWTSGTALVVMNGAQATAKFHGSGSGTVTSIAADTPIVVTPSPITSAGTISCATCVVGPSGATDGHLAVYDGTTGYLIKDGGAVPAATSAPSGELVYGTGSGVTSSNQFKAVPSSYLRTDAAFLPTAGILGDLSVNQLATPAITSVTPQTGGGGKTATYVIVACTGSDCSGNHTAKSANKTTTDAADDLTAMASGNVLVWPAVVGATGGYDVYRTVFSGTTPATLGKIAHVAEGTLTYTDVGAAGGAETAPTANTTGRVTISSAGFRSGPAAISFTDPFSAVSLAENFINLDPVTGTKWIGLTSLANGTDTSNGAWGIIGISTTTGSGNRPLSVATEGDAYHQASGSIPQLIGVASYVETLDGTINQAKGFWAQSNHVRGDGSIANNYGLYIENQEEGDFNWAIYTNEGLVQFGDDVLAMGTLTLNGNTSGTIANYVCTTSAHLVVENNGVCLVSSLRYKKDVEPFTHGLDYLEQLAPITWNWKDPDMHQPQLGPTSAEQAAAIDPLLATYRDGQPESINDRGVLAVLVNAVKEQEARIQKLEGR